MHRLHDTAKRITVYLFHGAHKCHSLKGMERVLHSSAVLALRLARLLQSHVRPRVTVGEEGLQLVTSG